MSYVEFHSHDTVGSILDGHGHPEARARRAAELGMPALGVSNHGTLYSAFKHYKACNDYGIKPIIGMEAYFCDDMKKREPMFYGELTEGDRARNVPGPHTHLGLYARTAVGLRNLFRLHSKSYLEGYYHKPRIDLELLSRHSEGLVIFTGCAGSKINTHLRLGQRPEAEAFLSELRDLGGSYVHYELMNHGLDFDVELTSVGIAVSEKLSIPIIATNDTHYTFREDSFAHECMLALGTQSTLADEKRFKFNGEGYHLRGYEEMLRTGLPEEAIKNTVSLAETFESYDEVFSLKNLMPEGDPRELRELALSGLRELGKDSAEYLERLDYEISIIGDKGYAGYFLCLADIILWAKSRGILVGNGRGSGAASVVAFGCGITNIDPLEHGLLFERFLNPERLSPPDIDTDFESSRRDEVISYVIERFGSDRVCQILTLDTIATARSVLDSAKVLGLEAKEGFRLRSLVPLPRRGRTVELSAVKSLRRENREVYDLALGLEGQVRNTGIHPGGVIVSPVPLHEVMPVKSEPRDDGRLVSGFDMGEVEALGAVKLDLLGIRTLDVIKTALEMIK